MKFLLIVLAVHLVVEFFTNRKTKQKTEVNYNTDEITIHPAEFDLRR